MTRPLGSMTIPLIVPAGDCANEANPNAKIVRTRQTTNLARTQPSLDPEIKCSGSVCRRVRDFVPSGGSKYFCPELRTQRESTLGHGSPLETRSRDRHASRMVRIDTQIRKQKTLTARALATAVGLDRHKYGIDFCQRFGIVKLENPALLGNTVLIKYAQVKGLLFLAPPASPSLKAAGVL